jgi:hypothetical protein
MPFVSVRESIELVRIFDRIAARNGIRPTIADEAEARRLIWKGAFVFVPPSPSKLDVIESGLRHYLFPAKSTRHLIPARPVGVSFPLEWLLDATVSAEEANRRLSALLSGSKIITMPAGSEYMGRTYEEPLYRYVREEKGPRSR